MNAFSISDLQQFSGIKAHTIRMWEQRYGALKPDRSEGNTRYYNGHQLRRLLNIASLLHTDYKVSELCTMSDAQLHKLLDEQFIRPLSTRDEYEYYIAQIVAAAVEYNEAHFDKLFSSSILRFGMKDTYVNVIYPSLLRLGLLWAKDALPPAQEHFITALFRQKFLSATDALPPPKTAKDSWVLFLPEDEFHETGLLFASFLIRHAGKKVYYLGANLPFSSLQTAVADIRSVNLLLFFVRKYDGKKETAFIRHLLKTFPKQKIYVACEESRLPEMKKEKNLVLLHSVQDLENELK